MMGSIQGRRGLDFTFFAEELVGWEIFLQPTWEIQPAPDRDLIELLNPN